MKLDEQHKRGMRAMFCLLPFLVAVSVGALAASELPPPARHVVFIGQVLSTTIRPKTLKRRVREKT